MTFTDLVIILFILALLAYAIYDQFIMPRRNGPVLLAIPLLRRSRVDGMIFVGLSGGKIQAFNAKTLESLWIYTDPLGGQPNTSPTYHDGYIYVGFWTSSSSTRATNPFRST